MNADQIKQIDAQARHRFTYLADAVDEWRSHADDVKANRQWEGDCDDLASTTLDLLSQNGMSPENMYRVMVSSTGGTIIDHMIGYARDDPGVLWVVGDTFGASYKVSDMSHVEIQYSPCTDIVWIDSFKENDTLQR